MKRFWIGVIVLAVMLVSGFASAFALGKLHNTIADTLEQAAELVQTGHREQAEQKVEQAAAMWEKYHHLAASFADHEPLEQIDSLFAQLRVYFRVGREKDIADACVQLSSLSRDVAESHGLSWWSLL